MTQDHAADTPGAGREIVLTRLLDAPRERVFAAWTRPEHVVKWWGPGGFTTTVHEMDVRPGGNWRFVMHGPGGKDYPNRIVFKAVEPPARLYYAHGDDVADGCGVAAGECQAGDEDGGADVDDGSGGFRPAFHAEAEFIEEGRRTRLVLRMIFDSPEARSKVASFGAIEGGRQTLDRLAAYLAKLT